MKKNKDMTYWEHIYEIRNRLLITIISILIFSVIGYFIFPYSIQIIINIINEELYVTAITEGFTTRLKISFIIGIIFTIPLFLFEIILMIFAALSKKEKIFILISTISSFMLFILGTIFSYKIVLPISVRFLKSSIFFPESVDRLISYNTFITFFFQFLLGFGICFQFPIIIMLLLKLKIIKMDFLLKNFKYFIIICFILSAILTPPDIQSQILLGLPMILLYLLCIILGKIFKIGL